MSESGPRIRVNGEEMTLAAGTLAELLERLGYPGDRSGLALAINGEVVRRTEWTTRTLKANDEIEIVGAVQGG